MTSEQEDQPTIKEARTVGWIMLILSQVQFYSGIAAGCLRHWYYLPIVWALAFVSFECFLITAAYIRRKSEP